MSTKNDFVIFRQIKLIFLMINMWIEFHEIPTVFPNFDFTSSKVMNISENILTILQVEITPKKIVETRIQY